MIPLPNDVLAIELGMQFRNAKQKTVEWSEEVIHLGNMIWNYCELQQKAGNESWVPLELTFTGSINLGLEDYGGL